MILKLMLFLLPFTSLSHGANILAIIPTPSYSHQIAYTHIWKELSSRGHNVTVITTDPVKNPNLTNLTEIDMNWTYDFMKELGKAAQKQLTMWNAHRIINNMFVPISEAQLSHPEVQNLIHNKNHFDVVLAEFVFPEFLAFAEIYDCPKIIFASMDATAAVHSAHGNPTHPILYPDLGAIFFGTLNFKERVISTLYTWYTVYFYNRVLFESRNELVRKYFGISKGVRDMVNDADMLFINVNPILQHVRALGPTTITIGGHRDTVSSTPLPQDVAEFLDSAKDGFIYFSLGSNVKSKELSKETLNAITDTFRELPYKVLWKFEADKVPNKPDNVKLIKWAPQQTVLSHPHIKVFVTQGGLQSFEEALFREVPFVVIPFFGDQEQNARIMESKGIAVVVDKTPSVSKIKLKNAILEVIKNPKYRNAVRKLKHLASDFPMTGLEKAVWWTEYVIRNKGAKHLRNPAADLPLYQYYLLDVIAFLVTVSVITLLVLFVLFKRIIKLSTIVIEQLSANKKKIQ